MSHRSFAGLKFADEDESSRGKNCRKEKTKGQEQGQKVSSER